MNEDNSVASAGHELTDAPIRPVVVAGAALALVTAAVFVISGGVFHFLSGRRAQAPANPMATSAAPAAPRIETAPFLEYQRLRAVEDRILSTYGWVDHKTGTVRIPIDRAIELQLQRGFPVRKEGSKE